MSSVSSPPAFAGLVCVVMVTGLKKAAAGAAAEAVVEDLLAMVVAADWTWKCREGWKMVPVLN